jgi:predicted  nucleic acid-binding Zn-ribbon protein
VNCLRSRWPLFGWRLVARIRERLHLVSIFRRTTRDSADLKRVRAEIWRLNEAMHHYDERTKQFEDVIAGASATAPQTQPDPAAELASRIDTIAQRLDVLDGRLSAVSTELANQLSELGNDIEALNNRPPGAPIAEETIEELRDTQTRLASEQARYQIAFREDLARLAEQLRRPGDATRRGG